MAQEVRNHRSSVRVGFLTSTYSAGVSTSGTGAITFAGSGTATSAGVVTTGGTGAITFAGAGVATSAGVFPTGGAGAITFDGDGVAHVASPGHGHIDFAGHADVDVAPRLDVYAPPEWSWLVLEPDGTPIGPLTMASARRLTFQLDGAASVAFTMPGEHPQTATITELATDVYVGRNGRPLFRGRIGGSTETHAATTDSVTLAATDYRGLLEHRLVWPESTLVFEAADQSEIAWQLIAESQALGDLGITRGVGGATGVVRDRTFTAGTVVAQAIKGLGGVADGFDWEIDAYLAFNLYHPQRGRDSADPRLLPTLTYGRDVVAVTTTVDPGKYANAVYFTGSTSETTAAEAIATPPAGVGRWERQLADPNATLQATVDEEAAGKLADAAQLISAITVTLAADVWNPYVLWLGDMVRVLVRAGRLELDVTRRIVQIDVTLDDTGVETVTLNIGSAPPKLSDRLNALQRQLSELQIQPGGGGSGGGGPGGGGIEEITSSDGTIVVTNPTGPTTNLEVASGVGAIVVTNPTGPVVDLVYRAGMSESVHNVYGSVTLLTDEVDHGYGFFSFASGPDASASWLANVPGESAGYVMDVDTGEDIVQLLGAGTYTLSAHVETTVVPRGTNIDGDVVVAPIDLSFSGIAPWFGVGGHFLCGVDGPTTFTAPPVVVTTADLAYSPHAGWQFNAKLSLGIISWVDGGAVSIAITLTRAW